MDQHKPKFLLKLTSQSLKLMLFQAICYSWWPNPANSTWSGLVWVCVFWRQSLPDFKCSVNTLTQPAGIKTGSLCFPYSSRPTGPHHTSPSHEAWAACGATPHTNSGHQQLAALSALGVQHPGWHLMTPALLPRGGNWPWAGHSCGQRDARFKVRTEGEFTPRTLPEH